MFFLYLQRLFLAQVISIRIYNIIATVQPHYDGAAPFLWIDIHYRVITLRTLLPCFMITTLDDGDANLRPSRE